MKNAFKVSGGVNLRGEIEVSGSKNSTFPILAATIMAEDSIKIRRTPEITDINIMLDIMKSLGIDIDKSDTKKSTVLIRIPNNIKSEVPFDLGKKIRGGLYFLGALLAKTGRAIIPYPGGCTIGDRGFELHLDAMKQMGVKISEAENKIVAECDELVAANIELPFPSRGVTGNIMLAASRANGITKIFNANRSPEIISLGEYMENIGIKIKGVGTDCIEIEGTKSKFKFINNEYTIPADKIEAATLLVSGLITGGNVTVKNVNPSDLKDFLDCLDAMNVRKKVSKTSVSVEWTPNISGVSVISGLPPEIDADYEPLLASLLATLHGKYEIYDDINPGRHNNYISELRKMGAKIEEINQYKAYIEGTDKFNGSNDLYGKDIRGTVAIILLALAIEDNSVVYGVEQVDRGYEKLDDKLRTLGAKIQRVIKE